MKKTDLHMSSVSQQDALSNALLSIFVILILIMIQLGVRDIDAMVFERTYGKENPAEEAQRGPSPKSVVVRARTVTVLTYSNDIHWNEDGPRAIRGSWSNAQDAPIFQPTSVEAKDGNPKLAWIEIDPADNDFDWHFKIENKGTESAEVFLWLDDGLPGSIRTPYVLPRESALFVHWCRQDMVLLYEKQDGDCP